MTKTTFLILCVKYLINPDIALENNNIQIALANNNKTEVERLLKEGF